MDVFRLVVWDRLTGVWLDYFNTLSAALEIKSRTRSVNDKITYAAEVRQGWDMHALSTLTPCCADAIRLAGAANRGENSVVCADGACEAHLRCRPPLIGWSSSL